MDDVAFDHALIKAAFALAAERGWHHVSVAAAAQAAELPLSRARQRFPTRHMILLRFERLADQAALTEATLEGSARDRLFGLLMRRIDTLQSHRAGVLAIRGSLTVRPRTALWLALATRHSMRWMLEGSGIRTDGLRGELRVKGLLAVWLWTIRAWRTDQTEHLDVTMTALDKALSRAEQMADFLGWRNHPAGPPSGASPDPPLDPAT
jgi:hypothetical protein